ncbi:unnamed protein product [Vitrella brassicaformis CCMP3155]|uniref:BTB domain-containing protein n=2 Tax=Vitrella brassicaformis TaxID=1169539 RepID=A0A0G4FMR6_VITBC|nr:unnamed protein product [Vitrella brassicaformis CCMP3155]|eukprot:CEM15446.1 unnamed protein product [Vitrella brassicaformis CCMP3155]
MAASSASQQQQSITVKFEAQDGTSGPLVISRQVAQQFGFFNAMLRGEFSESSERSVVLREVSRDVAAVVLRTPNDIVRDLTQENFIACLEAVDFLQYEKPRSILKAIKPKVVRNRWLSDNDIASALLKASFRRPLIRRFISEHDEVLSACGPFVLQSAGEVAAVWDNAPPSTSQDDGTDNIEDGDGDGKPTAASSAPLEYVMSLLNRLLRSLEAGTYDVSLSSLKRFATDATRSGSFPEAAADIFECTKLSEEKAVEITSPGEGKGDKTDDGRYVAVLHGSERECDAKLEFDIRSGPYDEESSSEDMKLAGVRTFDITADYCGQANERTVFCYSFRADISIDTDKEPIKIEKKEFDFSQGLANMPVFVIGLLWTQPITNVLVIPFKDSEAFEGKDTTVASVKASVTIRHYPMRCLVLHCLRLMIREGQWADMQGVGAAITRQVAEQMAVYLARMTADGVSPLRVLTSWMSGWGSEQHLDEWTRSEVSYAALSTAVMETHIRDLAPFIRVFGQLIADKGGRDDSVDKIVLRLQDEPDTLRTFIESMFDDGASGGLSTASGGSRKRGRISIGVECTVGRQEGGHQGSRFRAMKALLVVLID